MPDSSAQPHSLFTATILQIFRTNGQMISWGDRFSAAFGLTSARWQMLGALALAHYPLTAPQMASNMGVSRQGAQKQLNMLLNERLIERRHNPCHKRSPLYQLTPDGQTIFQRINSDWNQHAEQIEQDFSSEQLATALQVLNRIHELHQSPEEGANS
ncbi:MarR family winged helix-turn-helix transcriptional regulator [Marinobacter sp.]|uniref:MarR family winged helix-turn-helix transcriptional regulator n=1 Tax=Marinobacter sp. TaxID=50741 RepID=UPI003F98F9E9